MSNLEIAFALPSVFPPDGCALGKSSTSFLAGIERLSFESARGLRVIAAVARHCGFAGTTGEMW